MADVDYSTLEKIIIKVRRLTRSPSVNQLTDTNIKDYVNTFILYDFPEHVRELTLKRRLTFFCDPYIDTYDTNTTNLNDPLYNFKNRYIQVGTPIYIAGNLCRFSQDETQFYSLFPKRQVTELVGTGDGNPVTVYQGTLTNIPVNRNSVLFSSIDPANNAATLIDNPTSHTSGNLIVPNNAAVVYGTINYITGVYIFFFPAGAKLGTNIYCQAYSYVPGTPTDILYYENKFVLRPIPDQPYRIEMAAYIRPTELLAVGEMPDLCQWWQYIAFGAAKKIFEDRMDLESVSLILPEFKEQESLLMRRTIQQQSGSRVPTIYSEGLYYGPGDVFGNNGYF